jgi:hypothetical protein
MAVDKAVKRVVSAAQQWASAGAHVQPDGTRCFGRLPQIGPLAWLYIIYPPLVDTAFPVLEERLGRSIPDQYRSLLTHCNGLNLFADSLSLDGFVLDYDRSSFFRQPYDLATPNLDERPEDAHENAFFIGGYGWDGSLLYLDGRVFRSSRESSSPLDSWPTLAEMLTAETDRFEQLVRSAGGPGQVKEALPSHGSEPRPLSSA